MNSFLPASVYCNNVFDGTHETPKHVKTGHPFVTSKNIMGRKLDLTSSYNVSESDYNSFQIRSKVSQWDVLFSLIGSVGEVYLEKEENIPYAIKNIGVFSCKDEYKAKWLYYYLQSPYAKAHISNYLRGAVQKFLPLGLLREFPIPHYDKYNNKIIDCLFDLDTKIELNQHINAELESMAKFVFRQWFVENKETGNWEVGKLGDLAENLRRSANPDEIKPDTHYFGLEHMPRKSIALTDWGNSSELASNKYAFKEGEFLFGKLRPYFHKVGIAPVDGVCSTDILVIAPKSPDWYGFVLGHISSDELIKYADVTSGGTKMPRANWTDLARFEIPIPPVETAKKYLEFFLPVSQQIRTNILESRTLTELRDWLLPMLMNGQVTIQTSEAPKIGETSEV